MDNCQSHHHGHSHHGHDHSHKLSSLNSIFVISIVLNLLFVAIEAGVGLSVGSLGLLSDAGHNLGDVFSLLLALFAFKLAKVHSNSRYTYGYKKSTVLISLLNAIILLAAVGAIAAESIHKFSTPSQVDGAAISWTAGAGIIVNGLTAWLLMRSQKEDINVRGAFLHMAADTLVSVGVVVSGIVISTTGLTVIDPVISLVIAIIILVSTWKLLAESLRMSLDGIPEGIDIDKVKEAITSTQHVKSVHHLHVWAISTTDTALTAHIVLDGTEHMEEAKESIRARLAEMGISHATLETETADCKCSCTTCD